MASGVPELSRAVISLPPSITVGNQKPAALPMLQFAARLPDDVASTVCIRKATWACRGMSTTSRLSSSGTRVRVRAVRNGYHLFLPIDPPTDSLCTSLKSAAAFTVSTFGGCNYW